MRRRTLLISIALIFLFVAGGVALSHRSGEAVAVPPPVSTPGLDIVSLNLATETNVQKMLGDLNKNPSVAGADILLLQEVSRLVKDKPSAAELLAAQMKRQVYFESPVEGATTVGLAILSRYPIREPFKVRLKTFNLRFRSRDRLAIGVTVESPFGPVRVYDTHLDTRISSKERLEQLQPILKAASQYECPVLIGGDLNTNFMGWVARTVPLPFADRHGEVVLNFMTSHGYTTPFVSIGSTFDFLGMHLDWVFLKRLRSVQAGKQPIDFSDHHAIWTRVVPN